MKFAQLVIKFNEKLLFTGFVDQNDSFVIDSLTHF